MAETIKIDYPRFLANSMRMDLEEFGQEMKISALVKLFELGKISSGIAARVLNISRLEFLNLLGKYKVSYLDVEDLSEDLENA
ncbi:MAG: UPF0175 family protein [Weeksellaceae bacterium]|nr:UPF0175 family protein [Weeksellaceae bacterium]